MQYEELQTSFNFKDLKVVAGDLVYTLLARDVPYSILLPGFQLNL